MSRVLREIDVNTLRTVDPKMLRAPSRLRVSRKRFEQQLQSERPAAPINFHALQLRIYDLMALDFTDLDDFSLSRAMSPGEIEETFYQHLRLVDERTLRMLEPLLASWQSNPHTLVSARIMDVLRFRRMQLRKGMEAPLQDLLDWLLLCARLDERLTVGGVQCFIAKLGPHTRRAAEAVLSNMLSQAGYGEERQDDVFIHVPLLYLALRDSVRAPLNTTAHFTGRYYTMAFDDLIAMDDAVPLLENLFDSRQPHITPLMRSITCEILFDLAVDERMELKIDTYFLATTLLDRFLATRTVSSGELFLYGSAALVAAAKYEEIYTIRLDVLAARNRNVFTVEALKRAEADLLTTLGVRVGVATLCTLGNTMIVEQDPPASPAQKDLLLYILATLSVRTYFGQHKQSMLAAAAVYISRVAFTIPTGEPSEAVREVFPVVLQALEKNKPSAQVGRVLHHTFSQRRFHEVSSLPLLQLLER